MNNNILSLKKNSFNIESQKSFYIEKLSLKNFRNHENLNLNLENTSILIYGGNGCGKTNILEAISLLSQGKGLRKANIENFSFIMAISNKLRLKKKIVFETLKKFRGLRFRQQIIYKNSFLTIINDSKSTSFSSSISILKNKLNIYWLLGGIPKKGDKLNLPKKYYTNIKAFIYGRNKKFFIKQLKGKIQHSNFNNLNDALKKIFLIIDKKNFPKKNIIFSPSAASFDSFKNFEDRGFYFNRLVKKYLNGK